MPQLTPYYLSFASGLHLGTRGVNLEESATQLPSDTLFAALAETWRNAGHDPVNLAAPFTRVPADPPFLLTSAFPYAGDVRFYPAPTDFTLVFTRATIQARGKSIKRIRYWSEGVLQRALAGEPLDDWLFPVEPSGAAPHGVALQGGALWMLADEALLLPDELRVVAGQSKQARPLHALRQMHVFAVERTPRVTIDRIRSSSTIFHTGRTTFAQGCGLWFGVHWRSPQAPATGAGSAWQLFFAETLAQMEADGIGGVRSSGYGAFHATSGEPFHLPDAQPGQPALLLSRYHPASAELPDVLAVPAAYSLIPVAGWLRSPDAAAQRRKRLLLVGEGSIICPSAMVAGDVVDIRPEYGAVQGVSHPIYRYGLALSVDASKLREAAHG